jgi:hypothetical protein
MIGNAVFVARQAELERLEALLARTLDGHPAGRVGA